MATAHPVFWASRDDVKAHLRLTHVQLNDPTDLALDDALRSVRSGFISKLGIARINEIKKTEFLEEPDTQWQAVRFIANDVELLWVRYTLLTHYAARMLDAGGSVMQEWNFEGFFREMSSEERESYLYRLMGEINSKLDQLESLAPILGTDVNAQVFVLENNNAKLPRETIFPRYTSPIDGSG